MLCRGICLSGDRLASYAAGKPTPARLRGLHGEQPGTTAVYREHVWTIRQTFSWTRHSGCAGTCRPEFDGSRTECRDKQRDLAMSKDGVLVSRRLAQNSRPRHEACAIGHGEERTVEQRETAEREDDHPPSAIGSPLLILAPPGTLLLEDGDGHAGQRRHPFPTSPPLGHPSAIRLPSAIPVHPRSLSDCVFETVPVCVWVVVVARLHTRLSTPRSAYVCAWRWRISHDNPNHHQPSLIPLRVPRVTHTLPRLPLPLPLPLPLLG